MISLRWYRMSREQKRQARFRACGWSFRSVPLFSKTGE